jgi:hypothetical protein
LRYLYHNRGDYKKRRDIQAETGLTKAQFDYVIDDLVGKYVDREPEDDEEEDEKDEDKDEDEFPDAYEYHINSDGRAYVRNHIDEIPVEQQNSEELEKHKKEIMRLRSAVNEVEDDLAGWIEYSSEWNSTAKRRFEAIEERLEQLEDALLDEN